MSCRTHTVQNSQKATLAVKAEESEQQASQKAQKTKKKKKVKKPRALISCRTQKIPKSQESHISRARRGGLKAEKSGEATVPGRSLITAQTAS